MGKRSGRICDGMGKVSSKRRCYRKEQESGPWVIEVWNTVRVFVYIEASMTTSHTLVISFLDEE